MNVALIEFNPFHDECIFPQAAFIRSDPSNKVVLVYNKNLKDRINYWDKFDATLPISSNQWGIGYFRIINFLTKHKVEYVVFNSLHNPGVRSLLRFSFSGKRKFYGIVHDLKSLDSKLSKQVSNKMAGCFLLNDFLLERAEQIMPTSCNFSSFYPIFFPDFDALNLKKNTNEIWITIPGLMEPWRRDYGRLFDSFSKGKLNKSIKLLFLGKSSDKKGRKMALRTSFEEVDEHNQCLFWDGFVDHDTFHSYLRNSDYLLPLLHAGSKASDRYKDKITGLYNLGFGYQKRFIMDNLFNVMDDFKDSSIFYGEDDDIVSVLNMLDKPAEDIIYNDEKFKFDYQAMKYLEFLQS